MENLQNRKKEIIEQIGIHGLKQLKFSKLLKRIKFEIQELTNYWTLKQVHKMVNEVFDFNISAPLFYRFCQQNLKKDEIKKDKKINVGASQNKDIKKELILSDDELNAIAMFDSSSKNQVKD